MAFTLLLRKDFHFAGDLVSNLELAGQDVSEELLALAKKVETLFRRAVCLLGVCPGVDSLVLEESLADCVVSCVSPSCRVRASADRMGLVVAVVVVVMAVAVEEGVKGEEAGVGVEVGVVGEDLVTVVVVAVEEVDHLPDLGLDSLPMVLRSLPLLRIILRLVAVVEAFW